MPLLRICGLLLLNASLLLPSGCSSHSKPRASGDSRSPGLDLRVSFADGPSQDMRSPGADAQPNDAPLGADGRERSEAFAPADHGAASEGQPLTDRSVGPPADGPGAPSDTRAACLGGCPGGACVGGQCHTYPRQRVGIFYLAWHAFAWDATQQRSGGPGPSMDQVIAASRSAYEILPSDTLRAQAMNFHFQATPAAGYYCLYRKRPGASPYAEPLHVPDCPGIDRTAARHAQDLWNAGVDFIFVDLTNLQGMSPFADVLGIRPLEVLFEEWTRLRAAGQMTPQIAAWVPAPDKTGEMVYERALALYNRPEFAPLVLRDKTTNKKVLFLVHPSTTAAGLAAAEGNGGRNDVLAVRLWGLLDDATLASGVASWMQPCQHAGQPTTILAGNAPCNQGYSPHTPIGSVVSASVSYQRGYASLPFQSTGRQRGLTFKRQFQQVLSVQPDYLLINSWNELIAQPQANPHPASAGALRQSMGIYDESGQWLWVDGFGAEFLRDIEPTAELGDAAYHLLQSCVRAYRGGGCAMAASEACCQDLDDLFVVVHSIRAVDSNGAFNTHHVLTTSVTERTTLLGSAGWEEVCNPFYSDAQLCGSATKVSVEGPFALFTKAGTNRAGLWRCYTGKGNFFTKDPACEGQQIVGRLGYLSTTKSSETPRPLRRCYHTSAGFHFHALAPACPLHPEIRDEGVLGYVR